MADREGKTLRTTWSCTLLAMAKGWVYYSVQPSIVTGLLWYVDMHKQMHIQQTITSFIIPTFPLLFQSAIALGICHLQL